jgi:hypothetical protein
MGDGGGELRRQLDIPIYSSLCINYQTYRRAEISAVELIRYSQLLQAFRVRCGSETERRLR